MRPPLPVPVALGRHGPARARQQRALRRLPPGGPRRHAPRAPVRTSAALTEDLAEASSWSGTRWATSPRWSSACAGAHRVLGHRGPGGDVHDGLRGLRRDARGRPSTCGPGRALAVRLRQRASRAGSPPRSARCSSVFLEPDPEPLRPQSARRDGARPLPLPVRFSDVDAYRHVNNVKYFEYFQEARIAMITRLRRATAARPVPLGMSWSPRSTSTTGGRSCSARSRTTAGPGSNGSARRAALRAPVGDPRTATGRSRKPAWHRLHRSRDAAAGRTACRLPAGPARIDRLSDGRGVLSRCRPPRSPAASSSRTREPSSPTLWPATMSNWCDQSGNAACSIRDRGTTWRSVPSTRQACSSWSPVWCCCATPGGRSCWRPPSRSCPPRSRSSPTMRPIGRCRVRRRARVLLCLLHGNLANGLSYGWWIAKHNAHHAHPNDLETDPDVAVGAFVWDAGAGLGPARTGRLDDAAPGGAVLPPADAGRVQPPRVERPGRSSPGPPLPAGPSHCSWPVTPCSTWRCW